MGKGKAKWIAGGFLAVLALALFALFSSGSLPELGAQAIISGTADSELLTLSAAPVYYQYGDGSTPARYIRAEYQLGGNDIATIGTYENESVDNSSVAQIPTDFSKQGTWTFTAKKQDYFFVYKVNTSGPQRVYRPEGQTFTKTLTYKSTDSRSREVQLDGAALSTLGVDCPSQEWFWNIGADTKSPGFFDSIGEAPVYFYCADLVGRAVPPVTVYVNGTDNGQLRYNLLARLTNNQGQDTQEVVLTNTAPTGTFYQSGQAVGTVRVTGFSQQDMGVPNIVNANAYPVEYGGALGVMNQTHYANYQSLLQNVKGLNPKTSLIQAQSAVAALRNAYESVVSGSKETFIGGQRVIFDGSNILFKNVDGVTQPKLLLNVKGDWVGITELAPKASLTCPPPMEGTVNVQQIANIAVENDGATTLSYKLDSTCGGLFASSAASIPQGSARTDAHLYSFAQPVQGQCTATLSYGTQTKTCSWTANISVQQAYCGDGRVNNNETCITCPQDFATDPLYPDGACTIPKTCPNGKIDLGETCETCPEDVVAVQGAAACETPPDCPVGQVRVNKVCVPECPAGFLRLKDGSCGGVPPPPPIGLDWNVVAVVLGVVAIVVAVVAYYAKTKKGKRKRK